jgi:hypothetical protein
MDRRELMAQVETLECFVEKVRDVPSGRYSRCGSSLPEEDAERLCARLREGERA